MYFFLVLLILLISLNYAWSVLDEEEISTDSSSQITPCVLKLTEKYFKSKIRSQGSLAVVNIRPDGSQFQRNILAALNENPTHDLAVMIKDATKRHHNASHVTEKAKNYFMLVRDKTFIADIIQQLSHLPTWNPLAQVMVFFTVIMDPEELESQTISVLTELFHSSILNVNVMSHRINSSVVQVTTWYPYEYDSCARTFSKLRLIDECEYVKGEPNSPQSENFFRESHYHADWAKIPDKFHNCDIKIAALKWEPYVHHKTLTGFYKGIDYYMVRTAAQQMRLNPVFSLIKQEEGNYFGSSTNESRFFLSVLSGEADMMAGGLTENSVSRAKLTSSVKYFQDDMTFCVSKAGLAPNWMNVFAIFDLNTWMFAIFLLQLTGWLLWKFSVVEHNAQGNFFWGLLQTLAVTLATCARYHPRKAPIRFYFLCLVIYGMHFNAAYQSFLISVLTRPRFKAQVSSLTMAYQEDFHFTGSENILNYFKSNLGKNPLADYVVKNYEICYDIDECLKNILTDPQLAVAVSRQHSENSPLIKKTDMFCFPRTENIYNFLVSVLAKRDYHLLPKLNDNIRRILESGLLKKWQEDSERIAMGSAAGPAKGDRHGAAQIVLKLDHIQGSFIVGSIGLIAAILAFVAEWTVYWLSTKKSVNSVRLRALEKLLCHN